MSKPESFIANSDYATLKNDAKGSLSITIPTFTTIPSGGTTVIQSFLDLGTRNASIRTQFNCSQYGNNWTPCAKQVEFTYTIFISDGLSTQYTERNLAIIERISPTRIRLYTVLANQSPYLFTVVSADQTITAQVNTFLSPFQQ